MTRDHAELILNELGVAPDSVVGKRQIEALAYNRRTELERGHTAAEPVVIADLIAPNPVQAVQRIWTLIDFDTHPGADLIETAIAAEHDDA
jgi:hypothetical protein